MTDIEHVPSGAALASACEQLGIDARTLEAVVTARAGWDVPAWGEEGRRLQQLIVDHADDVAVATRLPAQPPPDMPLLHLLAVIGLVPWARERHAALGIPSAITDATLWDLANQARLHLDIHGTPGFARLGWLAGHLTGSLVQLGRLQFQRGRAPVAVGDIASGTPFLDVHVPERQGPLTPAACDEAFAAARRFAPLHAGLDPTMFACVSWLLDPRLQDVLPATSNILAFQRRFTVVATVDDAPSRVFEFVFLRPDLDHSTHTGPDAPDLTTVGASTTLERAVVELHRRGLPLRQTIGVAPL